MPTATTPIRSLSVDPRAGYTDPVPWAPLTDAEWHAVGAYLCIHNCGMSFTRRRGRPPEDVRTRLDAIFRAVTLKARDGGRGTWSQLPEGFGKPDTVSRTYRRWAKLGLWERLLTEVADPRCIPELRRLAYFICCAFRRGFRLLGLRGMLLARRLGLYSALPSPPWCLPDPDLSEQLERATLQVMALPPGDPRWRPWAGLLKSWHALMARRRVNRLLEPA